LIAFIDPGVFGIIHVQAQDEANRFGAKNFKAGARLDNLIVRALYPPQNNIQDNSNI
jgi:hypothetical protein